MHAVIVALACSLAALSPVCCALAKTCSVDAYGAIGDGVALDTAAIQRAADDCTSNGTLTFTAGKRYLSGTFKLSGSVHVTLPYNTTILASGLVRTGVTLAFKNHDRLCRPIGTLPSMLCRGPLTTPTSPTGTWSTFQTVTAAP